MKKKLLSVLLSTAMLVSLLSGCGETTTETAESTETAETTEVAEAETEVAETEASGEVVEINWMFWDDLEATEDLMSIGYAEVIERFNTQYEGVYHCTPITTNLEEYDTKLNALIAANDCPDVYICNPGFVN